MKQETIDRIRKFTADRDWEQYHTPANLAKSISIEANELLDAIAAKCAEAGVAIEDVDVFTQAENGKLTQFAFYYDDSTDTAVIVKNMSARVASKFLQGAGGEVVVKAAKSPVTPKPINNALVANIEAAMDGEDDSNDEFPDLEQWNESEETDESDKDEDDEDKDDKD